jgi:calcineurin-like phosphoesterase
MSYRILFLGDVVGRPGRDALNRDLPHLKAQWQPLFTVVNGENAAGGVGITSEIAESIFALGVDAITLGNHAFNKREVFPYLNGSAPIVRPANMPAGNPGRGSVELTKDGVTLYVANLCAVRSRVYGRLRRSVSRRRRNARRRAHSPPVDRLSRRGDQ